MTSDGPALLAEICSNPEEDSVRLAFADWLEEQPPTTYTCHVCVKGWRTERSRTAEMDPDEHCTSGGRCSICNGAGNLTSVERGCVRAGLIRAQIERARLKPRPLVRTCVTTLPPIATGRSGLYSVLANFPPNTHPDLKIRDAVFDVIVEAGTRVSGCRILGCSAKTFDVLSDGSWSVLFHATQEPCPARVRCDELEAQIVRLHKETNHCPELGYTWVNEDYIRGPLEIEYRGQKSNGRLRRGFVEEVVCTAEEWLKIEGALVFHPKHLMECPTCTDPKWKRLPGIGCPGCKDGGAPIPCPLTAHPIRKVRLTTTLASSARTDYIPLPKAWFVKKWPGVEFELPPTSYQDQLRPGQEIYSPMEWVTTAERLVRDANYTPDEIDRVRRGGFQPEPRAEELAGDGPDS